MRFIIVIIYLLPASWCISQNFEPIPKEMKGDYKFNLQKNFFINELSYRHQFNAVTASLNSINAAIAKRNKTTREWISLIEKYNKAEADYRVIDLYLFLKYAINTNDEDADRQSDSLRNIIRLTRTLLKQEVSKLSEIAIKKIILSAPRLYHFIHAIAREKPHLLKAEQEKTLLPFQYLKSSTFYDKAFAGMTFDKIKTKDGEIDVLEQMSSWENHPDKKVRREGSINLFKGYATQRDVLGFNYIQMIKGLNAFSKAKNFTDIIDEKLFNSQLPAATLDILFSKIIEAANKRQRDIISSPSANVNPLRFTITEAIEILKKALGLLGEDYKEELSELLNPANGRIDIAGGSNRIPIRGTASVYPVYPSIFYAFNYEGFLIDLTLLAHEAGHAVQASLMTKNKIPLMYASGPGYFTESFGKFNELLLFDYLSDHETDSLKKLIYYSELKERLNVLYGSTEEAFVEYSLIKDIVSDKIKKPDDLDSVTYLAGSSVNPLVYKEEPERKGLWMLLETNFREPMHNINDMIASVLAIKYFELYKKNKNEFISAYLKLLKEGYHDNPANLLKKVNINIQSTGFIESVINFAFLQTEKK